MFFLVNNLFTNYNSKNYPVFKLLKIKKLKLNKIKLVCINYTIREKVKILFEIN